MYILLAFSSKYIASDWYQAAVSFSSWCLFYCLVLWIYINMSDLLPNTNTKDKIPGSWFITANVMETFSSVSHYWIEFTSLYQWLIPYGTVIQWIVPSYWCIPFWFQHLLSCWHCTPFSFIVGWMVAAMQAYVKCSLIYMDLSRSDGGSIKKILTEAC